MYLYIPTDLYTRKRNGIGATICQVTTVTEVPYCAQGAHFHMTLFTAAPSLIGTFIPREAFQMKTGISPIFPIAVLFYIFMGLSKGINRIQMVN
ncbi:hypothetical protein CEXT_810361 [Caerostris extrusa]|uniref:Uncharacterized protein n=1 Tax=Caerostris extrusa TaxID=172846 RepID=A0AAV4UD81_CAEEX|nr:hypothetical protein CEXT_810361 [Caerostris extrusa]